MLKWFRKDPSEKLVKAYERKLYEAMNAQRQGNIRLYASLSQEADAFYQEIQKVIDQQKSKAELS